MMKLILFVVVGLLVGIGGGSAVSVMQAKKAFAADVARKAKVVADSLARAEEEGSHAVANAPKDSSAHDSASAPPDDAHAAPAPTHGAAATSTASRNVAAAAAGEGKRSPSHGAPDASSASGTHGRAAQTVVANGGAPLRNTLAKPPALPAKPLPDASPAPGMGKVAKIFAAMPPKDAAKVLEQLDDAEVTAVISSVSEKQAAAILQNFPPARAAVISKAVLRSSITPKP